MKKRALNHLSKTPIEQFRDTPYLEGKNPLKRALDHQQGSVENTVKSKKISPKNSVPKKSAIHLLKGVIHQDVSKYVLADINMKGETEVSTDGGMDNINELTIVGRCSIKGTSKQLCHVIPVSFIKEMVKSAVKEAATPHLLTQKLSTIVTKISKLQNGYAFKSKDLVLEEYSSIASKMPSTADRALKNKDETIFLVSPSKRDLLFTSPTKMHKASGEFQKQNTKFIEIALLKLGELIEDDNTEIIVSELLIRYIFGLPNLSKNAVFAPEGNTSRFEIRLYTNKNKAELGEHDYEVMTARELQTMAPGKLNNLIRMVNSEGPNIKSYIASLNHLKKILFIEGDNAVDVDIYNMKFNKFIKLANATNYLANYNNPLLLDEDIKKQISYHIAKNLYLAFDLTALEDVVFVPVNGNIPVYVSAQGERSVKYGFMEGKEYRQNKMDETDYSDDKFFRNVIKDKEILPQKLVELFTIGFSLFASYEAINIGFQNLCLNNLVDLASEDYCMKPHEKRIFSSKIQEVYNYMQSSSTSDDLQNVEVALLGGEFNTYNDMLGFSSTVAELFPQ